MSSDDNADHVPFEDQYKYWDTFNILTNYDFLNHIASGVVIDQLFLDPQHISTQRNLDQIATWTNNDPMRLNEEKKQAISSSHAHFKSLQQDSLIIYGKSMFKKMQIKYY